jgi:hypothetical protein
MVPRYSRLLTSAFLAGPGSFTVEVYRPDNGKHFDIINPEQTQGNGSIDPIVDKAVK